MARDSYGYRYHGSCPSRGRSTESPVALARNRSLRPSFDYSIYEKRASIRLSSDLNHSDPLVWKKASSWKRRFSRLSTILAFPATDATRRSPIPVSHWLTSTRVSSKRQNTLIFEDQYKHPGPSLQITTVSDQKNCCSDRAKTLSCMYDLQRSNVGLLLRVGHRRLIC